MWDFFKQLEVIDENGKPTKHFGDPIWVYYKYRQRKKDKRSQEDIYQEGKEAIDRIEKRGVPIAQGYGDNHWDLKPSLEKRVQHLYEDAKESLWTTLNTQFIKSIPDSVLIATQSENRQDYVYHPSSGETLGQQAIDKIKSLRRSWNQTIPDIQIIISDGLNARALMDDGHVLPFLTELTNLLKEKNYTVNNQHIVIENGRVRAGYACGELLFGQEASSKKHGIIHIIGERPGSGHHNFSAYLTAAKSSTWNAKATVDHDISRVVSGISDTALTPLIAAVDTSKIMSELFLKS